MDALTTILGITAVAGLVVGALGTGLLYLLRRRPLLDQLLAAAALQTTAVAIMVLLEVRTQVVAGSNTAAILVALGTGLALAGVFVWRVSGPVAAALVQVGVQLHQLSRDGSAPQEAAPSSAPERSGRAAWPKELADLRSDLAGATAGLTAARERNRLAEEARRELVTFLSHDLRTPLAGLRALTEGLEDEVIDDVPRALAHLRTTAERMSGLVEDLFALTRLQGPRVVKQRTMISITEIILDVAEELAAVAVGRRVQIKTDLPVNDQLAVLGVAEDLTRALMNLVTNALRHTHAGAAVRVGGARAGDGRIQIAVVDGCGGIPEQDLPLIFGTGWRGALSPSGDDGGAGLGLAIARGVIHFHEGRIGVRNVEGGCRFEVDLPAQQVGSPGMA